MVLAVKVGGEAAECGWWRLVVEVMVVEVVEVGGGGGGGRWLSWWRLVVDLVEVSGEGTLMRSGNLKEMKVTASLSTDTNILIAHILL